MRKKAVVTLLGMLSHTKPDYISIDGEVKKIFSDIAEKDRAVYKFSEQLSEFSTRLTQKHYINTLPLLIDVFKDRDIIPIATQKAKDVQKKTLSFLKIDTSVLENTLVIDESNYEKIFQQISQLLQQEEYESFVIDLTHGFRHLPILMMVNLIITSIKDLDKIEHIFFAKEIINGKEYEIIDLLEYIGLAKLSFVLENFNTNYTVGNKLIFKNTKYQELVDGLRIISGHILANSIKTLIEGEKSLVMQTIENLEKLQKEDKNIKTFSSYIEKIIKHLKKIDNLKQEKDYIKLFKFSHMMKEREYLLNSITLLNESVGLYCAEKIRKLSPEISTKMDNYLKERRSSVYELAHQSRNIVKLEDRFNGSYLAVELPKKYIIATLAKEDNQTLKDIMGEIERLRNNLAHGNSSEPIDNVKGTISKLLSQYEKIIEIPKNEKKDIPIKIEQKNKPVKNSKEKIVPKGIDVSEDKISDFKDLFNNR